jgi:hypothetical protein
VLFSQFASEQSKSFAKSLTNGFINILLFKTGGDLPIPPKVGENDYCWAIKALSGQPH